MRKPLVILVIYEFAPASLQIEIAPYFLSVKEGKRFK